MRRSTRYVLFCLMLVLLFCFNGGNTRRVYAAGKKTDIVTVVKSVKSNEAGIEITWKKNAKADGYYIYRKGGKDKSFVKITAVKSAKKSRYVDKRVKNGVRYTYKVCSYKKKKKDSNSVSKSIFYLRAPEIRSLTNNGKGSFRVRYRGNIKASGYEISYAKNGKFKNSKTVKIDTNKKYAKIVQGLKIDSEYFVRVRAYKKVGKKVVYSSWSKKSSILITKAFTGYTSHVKTFVYDKIGSKKEPLMLWYMSKARVLGDERHTAAGDWLKIRYNKKIYYVWQKKGDKLFVSEKSRFEYSGDTYYEQAAIDRALELMHSPNKYGHLDSTGIPNEEGKYVFSCCGMVSYVLNQVVQPEIPVYQTFNGLKRLYYAGNLLNQGLKGELNTEIVCEGTPDYDKLRPGDVLFFKLYIEGDTREFNHCSMYMGKGEFIQCTGVYGGICIAPIKDMYARSFVAAIRMLPKKAVKADCPMYVQGKNRKLVFSDMSDSRIKVGKVKPGEKVTVLYTGNKNRWAYIKYGKNKYGCIKMKFLSEKKNKVKVPR